jgi:hypothetical protein
MDDRAIRPVVTDEQMERPDASAAEEEDNLRDGPLPERLVSRNWRVRVAAYEDLKDELEQAPDSACAEYGMCLHACTPALLPRCPLSAPSAV